MAHCYAWLTNNDIFFSAQSGAMIKIFRAFTVQTRACGHEEELMNLNPRRSSFKSVPNTTSNDETEGNCLNQYAITNYQYILCVHLISFKFFIIFNKI